MATKFVATLLLTGMVATPAISQAAEPPWLDDLGFQLQIEKACDIAYVMNLREGKLGGLVTYEARVKCEDGRMFDASRIGENEDFTFRSCEVTC